MDQKWKRLESGQFTSSLILGPYLLGWEAGKCNMCRKKRNSFGGQHLFIYPCVKCYQTEHGLGHENNPD